LDIVENYISAATFAVLAATSPKFIAYRLSNRSLKTIFRLKSLQEKSDSLNELIDNNDGAALKVFAYFGFKAAEPEHSELAPSSSVCAYGRNAIRMKSFEQSGLPAEIENLFIQGVFRAIRLSSASCVKTLIDTFKRQYLHKAWYEGNLEVFS
jgi:hypothetical protein